MERHEQQLETLATVSRLLAARGRQSELLAAVLDQLDRNLNMRRGTILLLMPSGRELVVAAARSARAEHIADQRYQLGEGIVGRVMETAQPALIPRVADEPRFMNRIHRRPENEAAGPFGAESLQCCWGWIDAPVRQSCFVDLFDRQIRQTSMISDTRHARSDAEHP